MWNFTIGYVSINPRSLEEEIVTRSLGGRGEVNCPPPPSPSTFDTIHPNNLKLGTYNKLHLYLQYRRNQVASNWFPWQKESNKLHHRRLPSWIFKFSDFVQIFTFDYFKMTRKQHLAVEIYKLVRIYREVDSI